MRIEPIKTQAEYVDALKAHDWSHEMSDDHSVWSRGRHELGFIKQYQQFNDPTYEVWNLHAPEGYKVTW